MDFIEHLAICHYILDEIIAKLQPPLYHLRGPDKKINGKPGTQLHAYLDRLVNASALEIRYHKQVHIGILCGFARGMRPEEYHPLSAKFLADTFAESGYSIHRYQSSLPKSRHLCR
jgi:hypothetical protein